MKKSMQKSQKKRPVGRPPKHKLDQEADLPELNRSSILDVAVQWSRDNGVSDLSMRNLAKALNVSPMAIYHHYKNRDMLVRAILNFIFKEIYAQSENLKGEWDEQLIELIDISYKHLKLYSGAANFVWVHGLKSVADYTGPDGDFGYRLIDRYLSLIFMSGLDEKEAVMLYHVLMQFTLSVAERAEYGQDPDSQSKSSNSVPERSLALGRVWDTFTELKNDEIVTYGARTLLDGALKGR